MRLPTSWHVEAVEELARKVDFGKFGLDSKVLDDYNDEF
jgi:hypothetical protein